MLSRVIKVSLVRAFSTANTPVVRSSLGENFIARSGATSEDLAEAAKQIPPELKEFLQTERKHLAYYTSEIKQELNDRININFETQIDDKTLIFESIPDYTSNHKLGEVLVLASTYGLFKLLLGFPSYLSIVGVLGTGALGGIWSYSNYLRRTSPQITHIFKTRDNLLQIHYLKPNGLFSKNQADFLVDQKKISHTSFCSSLANFIRKSNNTSWVTIEGKLFWYNSNPSSLRVNNHHLQSLI